MPTLKTHENALSIVPASTRLEWGGFDYSVWAGFGYDILYPRRVWVGNGYPIPEPISAKNIRNLNEIKEKIGLNFSSLMLICAPISRKTVTDLNFHFNLKFHQSPATPPFIKLHPTFR